MTAFAFNRKVVSLLVFGMLVLGAELFAQSSTENDLKDFKIVLEKNQDGLISMKSLKGSAWLELSFSLDADGVQAVDEYGMTKVGTNSSYQDSELTNFLFTVSTTEDGIRLKGLEGTAWTELTFSLDMDEAKEFNQFGTVSSK